jgi:hypothetical protein
LESPGRTPDLVRFPGNGRFRGTGFSLGSAAAAAASVFCVRSGFFAFFFLLPLGLAAFGGGAKSAWAAGILATAANLIAALWLYVYRDADPALLRWTGIYHTVMIAAFTWINAPLGKRWVLAESPWRVAAAAVCCTAVMTPVFLAMMNDGRLTAFLSDRLEGFQGGLGITVDEFLSGMVYAGLRGGILASLVIFWWVNRQLASGIIRLARRRGDESLPGVPAGSVLGFHAPAFLIWVLSLSLGAVVAGTAAGLLWVEAAGWNVLTLSVMLFFVQGGAVALHYLRRAPPFIRLAVNAGIVALFFVPALTPLLAGLLGALVLLGIAENWVPFRLSREEPGD